MLLAQIVPAKPRIDKSEGFEHLFYASVTEEYTYALSSITRVIDNELETRMYENLSEQVASRKQDPKSWIRAENAIEYWGGSIET